VPVGQQPGGGKRVGENGVIQSSFEKPPHSLWGRAVKAHARRGDFNNPVFPRSVFRREIAGGKVKHSFRLETVPDLSAFVRGFLLILLRETKACIGGRVYALNRATGKERWKLDTRARMFPGAHPLNVFFASPILAGGNVIVAGGSLEQIYAALPEYKGCTGRGFVAALEPKTGRVVWKYDVGAKPRPLKLPIRVGWLANCPFAYQVGRAGAKPSDPKRPASNSIGVVVLRPQPRKLDQDERITAAVKVGRFPFKTLAATAPG
jgi:hypothetical protein